MLLAYNENTFRASEERIAVVSTRVFRRVMTVDAAHAWGFIAE